MVVLVGCDRELDMGEETLQCSNEGATHVTCYTISARGTIIVVWNRSGRILGSTNSPYVAGDVGIPRRRPNENWPFHVVAEDG